MTDTIDRIPALIYLFGSAVLAGIGVYFWAEVGFFYAWMPLIMAGVLLVGGINGAKAMILGGEMVDTKNSIVGEEGTGFARGANGPFKCGNCIHMKGSACTQSVMVNKSHLLRDKDGNPKVDRDDCCTYVRRPGDK